MARSPGVGRQLLHVRHHGTRPRPVPHRRVGPAEQLVGGVRLLRDHDLLGGRLTAAGTLGGVPLRRAVALILMRMLRRAVLAVCVVLLVACGPRPAATSSTAEYVPWLPLHTTGVYPLPPSPSPGPPVPIPAGTPICQAAQLEAAAIGGYAATGGNVDSPVSLRDTGSTACYLEGYPDVTILDAAGRSLAQAIGSANRGTYFPEWPEGQVLLQPGTPLLPKASFEGHIGSLSRGQALLNVQWWDCHHLTAARLSMDLPNAAGNLTVQYPAKAPYNPACDS